MGYREQLGDEELSLIQLKSEIIGNIQVTLDKCGIWRFIRLTDKSARLVLLWRKRILSNVGVELKQVSQHCFCVNSKILQIDAVFLFFAKTYVLYRFFVHDSGYESNFLPYCYHIEKWVSPIP